jgi:predicted DNA-binding transcriptional regulator AlpA
VGRKVDIDDLLDAGQVAQLLGLTHRNAITLYQKRYDDMPRPIVVRNTGKTMLWLRQEIAAWAKQRDHTKP